MNIAVERARTRAALIQWLPPETVRDIVSEACGLISPLDRVRVLSEMVPGLPTECLPRVGEVLVTSLREVFPSRSLDRERVLHQGFGALSRVLDRSPSPEVTEHAMILARDEDLSPAGQVTLLVDLASAGGTASHVRTALAEAVRIAADDLDLVAIVTEGLSATHTSVLADLLIDQHEPSQLVAFLGAVAHLLDDGAKHEAYQRVAALDDIEARLAGLDALLPHLEESWRREAVSAELARKAEWAEDPELFVFAISALAPHAPEIVRPHLEGLVAAFGRLTPTAKLAFADRLANETDCAREIIDATLAAANELTEQERPSAIAELAPWLDPSQIAHAVSWLSVHQDLHIVPALVELIRRAAALGDTALVRECLGMPENRSTRSDLIEAVAPELPLETLSPAAVLEEPGGFKGLGALAVRAAELGDMGLALSLLDQKGASRFSGDQTLERVYQLAPSSWVDTLIARAENFYPWERATALVGLVDRTPHTRRRALVESIVESAASLRVAQNEKRLHVIRALEPELRCLPASAVVSMWTNAMRCNAGYDREEVLIDIRAFAPTLVSHLGPEIVLKLDEAIRLGGREVWP
jgi:hypothetical protein